MVCVPTVNAEVLNCAVLPDKVIVFSAVAPSENVTVPLGVPPPLVGVTVAVKVTELPNVDGLTDDVMLVDVGAAVIVWETVDEDVPNEALPL